MFVLATSLHCSRGEAPSEQRACLERYIHTHCSDVGAGMPTVRVFHLQKYVHVTIKCANIIRQQVQKGYKSTEYKYVKVELSNKQLHDSEIHLTSNTQLVIIQRQERFNLKVFVDCLRHQTVTCNCLLP